MILFKSNLTRSRIADPISYIIKRLASRLFRIKGLIISNLFPAFCCSDWKGRWGNQVSCHWTNRRPKYRLHPERNTTLSLITIKYLDMITLAIVWQNFSNKLYNSYLPGQLMWCNLGARDCRGTTCEGLPKNRWQCLSLLGRRKEFCGLKLSKKKIVKEIKEFD